ncbi:MULTISPECIES: hypothetical protein [unclassified Lysobacter]|uniref:hypothetical protein n=1 Tax=unclassified Lysobacter TaxID=2635362 RepID=UPI0006F4E03E|nr:MULTISPECIES: hypothetical protein [unclassified Lysobacter]KQZ56947.1 hypothetical protein ASD53_10675 [Lysobacter sp. Root559]KRC34791.1 hypothetical protein ASE10_08830 [Lysobacter sp. Root76]KRD70480.1 hypothetical protein ASE45_01000 [Lysobacter sp. Root96]
MGDSQGIRNGPKALTLAAALIAAALIGTTAQAQGGSGYFRYADARLALKHAVAVSEEPTDRADERRTLVFLSAEPLDAAAIAAAFDAADAVRDQKPAGGYVRVCIAADGSECGLYYSPEGFNSGGYGELSLQRNEPAHIAGRWLLAKGDFLGTPYDYDLRFDTPIVPAPGSDLPAGGGAPGAAYNAWLDALAKGDVAALRRMGGEDARWRFPDDDPGTVKESLKSLRDGEPLRAQISRGRQHADQAVLWVEGVDRDDIRRRGRVLMRRSAAGWQHVESDLDSVDE